MQYIAHCGLKCSDCPVFIATQTNDDKLKAELAEQYSTEECQFQPEDMVCAGCRATEGINKKMCEPCEIRICGRERGHAICAACEDYPCDLINVYVPLESENRRLLDDLARWN